MRQLFRSLTVTSVKDYVSIGAGLAAIVGGLITASALLLGGGGDGGPEAAIAPSETPVIAETTATATTVPTLSPTDTPPPPPTETPLPPAPTSTPAPRGEFLRVQFGTQQDPNSLLPSGGTVGPGEDQRACAGETLYAWVEHSFGDGDILNGRLASQAGTLYSASVPVDARAPNFWIGAQVSGTGIHTLSVSLEGGTESGEWAVNVTC